MSDKKNPTMRIHLSYSKEDHAVRLDLYNGDEGAIILLTEDQVMEFVDQLHTALVELEKNKPPN